MANIPANVIRHIFSGNMPGGEKWAAGFWSYAGSGGANAQAAADSDVTWLGSNANAIELIMSAQTTVTAVDTYAYSGGAGASSQGHAAVDGFAGSGSTVHPNQIALCVTMRSATPGRSGRNRMYWPATGIGMQTNGLFASGPVNDFVDAVAALMSSRHGIVLAVTGGVMHDCTAVDADYVGDDQRGRRRSLSTVRHRHAVQYL